ncbi:MAG: SDR family oxidoreductase [Candidatus Omnitrophota bacterium]
MRKAGPDVVMITGASAGVGRATAVEFAKRGCSIGLFARGKERLRSALTDVETLGGKGMVLEGDVSNFEDLKSALNDLEREFGPVDIFVNNAMTTIFSEFLDIDPKDFRRVTEVTYLGVVYGTRVALESMRKRDKGVIVQVGSVLAYRAIPLQSAYCGAKHAVKGFAESIRCELLYHKSGIHMTMVQLPGLNTPQFDWCKNNLARKSQPVPPIFQPEVAASAIVWAAYHRRRELIVGGNSAFIIRANHLFPRLGDLYLAKTGFSSQMRREREKHDRPFNLYRPVDGPFGVHGSFDRQAKGMSFQLRLAMFPFFVW